MKLPKSIAEWWPLALVTALLLAIGWFGTQIIHAAAEPFWKHMAPAIPQTLLLSLCCLLLLIIVLLVIWVIYLYVVHRQPTQAEIEKAFDDQFSGFDKRLGLWKHKTKSGYFCPNCKARHCESPMRERPDGWKCLLLDCGYLAPNPDYRRPQGQQKPPGGGWLIR